MRLLVSIPCLNEAETIGAVIDRIPRAMPGITAVDVLVVDDGSTDTSSTAAAAHGARVLRHGRNLGVGASFQTALRHAVACGYDLLVTIDADGQFAPEDIAKLVTPITKGDADFVTGSRFIEGAPPRNIPPLKLWGNARMSDLVSRLTGLTFRDVSCGFRAYSREAMLHLNLHGVFTYTQETFLQLSFKNLRIVELPVAVEYFPGRVSRVAQSIPKYALKTLSIILMVYRDYRPIRFFWTLAVGFLVLGASIASIMLVHYVRTGMFYGQLWAGFTGGFLLLVGFVFLILGIIADMLERIRQNQERILYHLKKREADGGRASGSAP